LVSGISYVTLNPLLSEAYDLHTMIACRKFFGTPMILCSSVAVKADLNGPEKKIKEGKPSSVSGKRVMISPSSSVRDRWDKL
jgi:hypothetical protein